ncbi:MAG: hypothetical protein JWO38_6127 [Gemmataceae bacterium]|nr:hypothetical protein [Gemmataceae bacterium]
MLKPIVEHVRDERATVSDQVSTPEPTPQPVRWVIVLEAMPDDIAPALRLRKLLKRALRDLRLKCLHAGARLPVPPLVGDEVPTTKPARVKDD